MFNISGYGEIELTRGDTARISVIITNEVTGQAYTPVDGDTLQLTVKKAVADASPVIQKTISHAEYFHIEPEDTKRLEFGKYKYDVQLTTAAGDVYTIIGPAEFKILQEVG